MSYYVEGLTTVREGESTVRRIGEYPTLIDAVKASEQLIDKFLLGKVKDGMTAVQLFAEYQKSGEVPYIFSDDDRTINVRGFNHLTYAKEQSAALLKPGK